MYGWVDTAQIYGSPNHRTGDITLCHYVFIGDFIDRGACSLETVLVLLALKVRYPSRITLIRGNHEDRNINMQYGFHDECLERCGEKVGAEIWDRINGVLHLCNAATRSQLGTAQLYHAVWTTSAAHHLMGLNYE